MSIHLGRRSFLKSTAALGAVATTMALPKKAQSATKAWSSRKAINLNIDNLRVAICTDPNMIQNDAPHNATIESNMQDLAMGLANASSASEAWAKIFQKPAGKAWSDVRVAIKATVQAGDHNPIKMIPKVGIINALCQALNQLGVPFSNMILFDAMWYVRARTFYEGRVGNGLPPGIVLLNGTEINRATMTPADGFPASTSCPDFLANGTNDILINIAVCKGHDEEKGGATLCMKNLMGLFPAVDYPEGHSPGKYISAFNRTDALVGGTPPQQQLCIVDALWGVSYYSDSEYDMQPNTIVMGVFAPAVDYFTVKDVRHGNLSRWSDFLGDFGYSAAEANALGSVTVVPGVHPNVVSTPVISPSTQGFTSNFNATITCSTAGATIRYTTDGSTPTASSAAYSTGIAISQTTTIKAIAYASGKDPSPMATAVYTKVTLRDPENPASTTAGLRYSYYEIAAELTACADMLGLTPASTGAIASFDSSWVTRPEYYALAFEGFINITTAGAYTFYTNSDDGSQLFIGNTSVVSNEGGHPLQEKSGVIGLKAGKHAIKVLYWQGYGDKGLEVSMSSNSMSKQVIPAILIFKTSSSAVINGKSNNHSNGIIAIKEVGRNGVIVSVNRKGAYQCALVKADGRIAAVRHGSDAMDVSFTEHFAPGVYVVRLTADTFVTEQTVIVK